MTTNLWAHILQVGLLEDDGPLWVDPSMHIATSRIAGFGAAGIQIYFIAIRFPEAHDFVMVI